MGLLELVKNAKGMKMVDEDGNEDSLKLLPGLSQSEFAELEKKMPCPIPQNVRDLLAFTAGFENGPLESLEFKGTQDFEMEDVFPFGLPIAHDGYGNHWVVDLISSSKEWGPIFYACHDPAVIVYQAESLEPFIEDVLRFANPPHKADLDEVHERYSTDIWEENPNVLSYQACVNSESKPLKDFASSLDETYLFIDLRRAKLGDGFSWGRYGPNTDIKRYGEERIFAYQVQVKKSFLKKLFGR